MLGTEPLPCHITDVSQNGIELELDKKAKIGNVAGLFEQPGAAIAVLVEEEGESPWKVPAFFKMRRAGHVELSFRGAPPQEANRLARLVSELRSENLDVTFTLNQLESCIEEYGRSIFKSFFSGADEYLFLSARDSHSTQEQQDYFALRNQFRGQAKAIREDYVYTLKQQVRSLQDLEQQSADTFMEDFTLLDMEHLDDILDEKVIINTVYESFQADIEKARLRFQALVGCEVQEPSLVVSPESLCRSFRKSISCIEIDHQMLAPLYNLYKSALHEHVDKLYATFNQILIDAGILPDLEISNQQAALRRRQREEAHTAGDTKGGPGHGSESDGVQLSAEIELQGQETPGSHQPYNSPENLYQTVRNLMVISKKNQHIQQAQYFYDAPASGELVTLIEELEKTSDYETLCKSKGGLKRSIENHLPEQQDGHNFALSATHSDLIDLFENMFDALVRENGLSNEFVDKLYTLKSSLLKRIILDETFFTDKSNIARLLLNRLTFIGGIAEHLNDKTLQQVNQVIEAAIAAPAYDVETIYQGSEAAAEVIDRQEELRKRYVNRTVAEYEGQEKLRLANTGVDKTIKRHGARDNTLPKISVDLLNAGWRQYFLLTWMNLGKESDEWQEAIEDFRTLLGLFQHQIEEKDFFKIIEEIKEATVLQMASRIEQCISSTSPGVNMDDLPITDLVAAIENKTFPRHLFEALPLDGISDYNDPDVEQDKPDERDLRILKQLDVDDWVGSPVEAPGTFLQVVWISDSRSQFSLAGRDGREKSYLNTREMADIIRRGHQIIKDDKKNSAIDRGIYTTLQQVYQELAYHRCHDELTALLNRKEFERNIERLLVSMGQQEAEAYMMDIDLDQFHLLNNICGNAEADKFLKKIAATLRAMFPDNDNIARIGGNEFAVVLEDYDEQGAVNIANTVRQYISEHSLTVQDNPYTLTASIGLARFDSQAESVASILRKSSSACVMAKEQGRDAVVLYCEDDSRVQHRKTLEEWYPKINEAIVNDDLYLKVQRIEPIVPQYSGEPHHEILLGLNDKEGQPIPIFQFIGAAEYFDKMKEVDRWVVGTLLDWIEANPQRIDDLHVFSINLSGHTVCDEVFLDFLVERIESSSIDNERLCFEVTETSAIENIEKAIAFISEIRNLGCSFSLDDFGTGFSSYEYLKRLPVDHLKIDGVFVKNIVNSPDDYAVVKSITEIGHYMGKKIIAEFVESDEIRDLLKEIGVDYAQGFGVDKPKVLVAE